jgi:response regulator RpfG family c-di-GMP phosphodiesterase
MQDNSEIIQVLYVDDEINNLESFKANFRKFYKIHTALSAETAKILLSQYEIAVLITDQKMPGTSGTQLLEQSVKEYPLQTRIMLTAYTDKDSVFDAFHKGLIYKYILKPWKTEELKEVIDKAYEIYSLNRIKEQLYQEWLNTNHELEMIKKNQGK